MAKALLLGALHDVLADYVVGLSPESLKVGVWSGKIVLNELQVNPEAVNQLRLPANIIHGTVKKLEVHIPWAHLGSKPVKVHLEGVCVLVGPVLRDSWGSGEVRERRLGIKRASLEKAEEKALKKSAQDKDEDKKGFLDKLLQRIVDNIEINVADIHIRYEDTLLVPGQTVSAGLCLESFVVTTTDENFVPQFIDRTASQNKHTKVHKMARVDGFSVYWRIDDKSRFELLPAGIRSVALRGFVAEQAASPKGPGNENGGGLEWGHVIRPTGAVLRVIHSDDPGDKKGPVLEASFEVDGICMDLHAEQYEQALTLKDSIAALANWQTFFPYRPKTKPMEDPKAWWRYAYICVTGKPRGWAKVTEVLALRKEYMPLLRKLEAADAIGPSSRKQITPLSPQESRRFDELEEELPVQSIVMFRAMVREERKRKREEERAKQKKEEASGGGGTGDGSEIKKGGGAKSGGWGGRWWGRIFSGDGKEADKVQEEGDVALEDLARGVEQDAEEKQLPPDYLQMRVTVRPQGSMRLYGRRDLPLLEAKMAAAATMERREDSSMAFSFRLARLDVLDLYTEGAVFPHMLKVLGNDQASTTTTTTTAAPSSAATPAELALARKTVALAVSRGPRGAIKRRLSRTGKRGRVAAGGGAGAGMEEDDPLLSINVFLSQTSLEVDICALPTDVVYNREAVDALVSVFSVRTAETEAAMMSASKGLLAAQQKGKELATLQISISLDVAAPKVIVPISSSRDVGFVLLDMGHAVVKGGSVDGGAMSYKAELSDMNVRLPGRKALLVKGTGDAIVEPFKIKADITMGGGVSKPGMALSVEVVPGVICVMSPLKIRTMFRVLDYVTKADLRAEGGPGERPVGLAAPNTAAGGGGSGVQRMGVGVLVAAEEDGMAFDVAGGGSLAGKGGGDEEPETSSVQMELHVKLPKVSLLLVESNEDAKDKDAGLLMEAAGMSMDLNTSKEDMALMMHLDAVTLEDRARPDDSPFRHMIYSTPDETSHGGLIHVTYWAASGGIRRVPPAHIADTDQKKYDMVVDARFSTLKLALDKGCVVKSTPFFKAITRQDRGGEEAAEDAREGQRKIKGGGGSHKSRADDTRSVLSAGTRAVVGAAKRMAIKDAAAKAILAKASLTSVSFELVRSGPWETVMRAGVSGMAASFSSNQGVDGGIDAKVTLVDIELTDVREEAKHNAYRMILAPLAASPKDTFAAVQQEGKGGVSTAGGGAGEAGGIGGRGPLMSLSASMDGKGSIDVDIKLASFACNLMVDPIKKSLVVMNEVNAALASMFGNSAPATAAEDLAPGTLGGGEGGLPALGYLNELDEQSEGASTLSGAALGNEDGKNDTGIVSNRPSMHVGGRDGGVAGKGTGGGAGGSGDVSPSIICVRLSMDDWRINLIEEPSDARSKVVVLRASAEALVTRSITPGEGGNSTEDTFQLSLLKMESLVDNPVVGGVGPRDGRRISQMLEPIAAEVHANLLSARGSLLSVNMSVMLEDMDAQFSYTDMMLLKGIVEQATASDASGGTRSSEISDSDSGRGRTVGINLMPETYKDANTPLAETEAAAARASARAGKQPSVMVALTLSAVCSKASMVLINDYEGQGVPVLDFSLRQLKAQGSGFSEDFSLEVSATMQASFFNVRVVKWEPLCEPWRPFLSASVGQDLKGRRAVQIRLACEEVVVFDVTSDFMETFLSTYWMLFSEGAATKEDSGLGLSNDSDSSSTNGEEGGEDGSTSSPEVDEPKLLEWAEGATPLKGLHEGNVVFKNRTGLSLVVGTTDYPEKSIKLGGLDSVRLPFETQRHRARAGGFDLRGKVAFVGWGDGDMESAREGLPPLHVDRTGVNVYPLLPSESIPAGHLVSAPVVVEAYQNQRFSMMTREWRAPYLPGDGPEFASKNWCHDSSTETREMTLDSISLPDDKTWEWRDNWHVDFSKEVGREIDASGWEYAVEFGGFGLVTKSRTRRDLDQARRRKWIRTRAPKALPLDDPFRPLYLAWEVDVTPQGRLETTIRSTVQVTNNTGIALDVRALCSAWPASDSAGYSAGSSAGGRGGGGGGGHGDGNPGPSIDGFGGRFLGSVAPGSTLDVPVKMVYASHLQVRPAKSGGLGLASVEEGFAVAGGERGGAEAGGLFEWSAPLPLLSNNVDTVRNDLVSCRKVAGGSGGMGGGGFGAGSGASSGSDLVAAPAIRLVVHAATTPEGCVVLTVLPPVTVVNSLPCPLSFRATIPAQTGPKRRGGAPSSSSSSGLFEQGHPSTMRQRARLLEAGKVPTAETAYLHTLEVGDGGEFSVKISRHGWSGAEALLPSTREELRKGHWAKREITFQLPCAGNEGGGGGCLEVRCVFEPRVDASCPALRVYVFCTHWLVDRSGLRLGFGVSGKRRLSVPGIRQKVASESGGGRAGGGGGGDGGFADSAEPQLVKVHESPVSDLSCARAKGAMLSTAVVGGLLYTDREYTFKAGSLPRKLEGATMVRTACGDKGDGSEHFLRFRVGEACTVHVLFDRRCPSPPAWLTSGFRVTPLRVQVAHRTRKGKVADCPFVVWSRDAKAGSWVNLGGNRAGKADTMYLVIVTEEDVVTPAIEPSPASSSPSNPAKREISTREDLEESWAIGTEGLALCNSPDEHVRVAVPEGAGRGGAAGNRGSGRGSGGRSGGGGRDYYGADGMSEYTQDSWSDELDVPAGTNGVFQVSGARGEVYELAVRAEACPGAFRRTTQVTIVPRYCVVNLLAGESIWLKEPGAPDSSAVAVPPGGRMPWHWLLGKGKRSGVRVRTEGTAWSYGNVAVDQVGTTALHIPFFGEYEDLDGQDRGQAGGPPMKLPEASQRHGGGGGGGGGGSGSGGGGRGAAGPARLDKLHGEQTVVHVDVKLADDSFADEYAVLVVFWKATDPRFAPIYSARNASPVGVCLHQVGGTRAEREILSAKAAWKLAPRETRQIGWAYPAADRSLLISAGRGLEAVELSADTVGNYAKIPTGFSGSGGGGGGGGGRTAAAKSAAAAVAAPRFVWASVVVEGATKVIHISARPPRGSHVKMDGVGGGGGGGGQGAREKQANMVKEAASQRKRESEAPALEVSLSVGGFGLSLIGPINGRRQEMLYAEITDVRAKLSRDRLSCLEASVGTLQVDNHLPDGLYPVLVSKREDEDSSRQGGNGGGGGTGGRGKEEPVPFLQLAVIKEVNQATNTAHFDYVAFRMLEVDVMADRATLLHLLVLYKPVQGYLMMWRRHLDSRAWVAKRTAEVLERGAQDVPGGFVDVDEVRRSARIKRKYFKTLRFHPFILRLSYARTPVSNELVEQAGMPIVNTIPSLVKSNVDLASYLVEDAFGSVKDISKNVIAHYSVAARMQILNLVGSMRALGSPADLISNVGGGAKALVYKPALGLVQGPAEFFEGVGQGAQSFVIGTLHGVFNSVAGVGGAVTDTVSLLAFDDDYRSQRERQKNKAMAEQGGVGQGFAQGGKDIAAGFTSGLSGLFTAPVAEAKKGGFGGFLKGVGKGVVGAVVKPVIGVSDSVVSVVQGISNETENTQRREHMRPKRALTKDSETGQFFLPIFSMEAAIAQALVEKGVDGKDNGSNDKYESHTEIGDLTIIFADTRLVIIKRKENDLPGSARLSHKLAAAPKQMVSKKWIEVASVDVVGDRIVVRRYEGRDLSLTAAQPATREELYRQFYVHRMIMGDPTAMRAPEEVFRSEEEAGKMETVMMTMQAHSSAVQDSLKGYRFGGANGTDVPAYRFTDSQLLDRAEKRLRSVGVGDWDLLDRTAWELVENWNNNHAGLNAGRCVCVVFINASMSTVQFLEIRKRDGKGYRLLMGPLCDGDTQQLMPGGVAILFAWGHPSSNILKKGYVVMVAETTAFSAVYAVQGEKVAMSSKSGFQAGFLEKTLTEWWSKQVVVIK